MVPSPSPSSADQPGGKPPAKPPASAPEAPPSAAVVGLKDIAHALGLSVATVSLALRGDRRVRRQTAARIEDKARQLGYVPNPLVAALAARRFHPERRQSGVPVGFITYRQSGDKNHGQVYLTYLQQYGEEMGYAVHHHDLTERDDFRVLSRVCYQRGYAGFILGPIRLNNPPLELDWDKFAVVCCGGLPLELGRRFDWVRANFFWSTRRAWERMVRYGYRRIGYAYLSNGDHLEEDDLRLSGIRTAAEKINPESLEIPFHRYTDQDPPEVFLTWAQRYRPDAVLGYSASPYYWGARDPGLWPACGFATLHVNPLTAWSRDFAGNLVIQPKLARLALIHFDSLVRRGLKGLPELPTSLVLEADWQDAPCLPVRHPPGPP